MKKYIASKNITINTDVAENVYAELTGIFQLNTSLTADAAENLANLIAFRKEQAVAISTDFTVIEVGIDNDAEVGDLVKVNVADVDMVGDICWEEEWVTLTVIDSNNRVSEMNYAQLKESIERDVADSRKPTSQPENQS